MASARKSKSLRSLDKFSTTTSLPRSDTQAPRINASILDWVRPVVFARSRFGGHLDKHKFLKISLRIRKANPMPASGWKNSLVRQSKPLQEEMLTKPSVSCCFSNRLIQRAGRSLQAWHGCGHRKKT